MPKSGASAKKPVRSPVQSPEAAAPLPAESVEILRAGLGVEVASDAARLRAIVEMAASISASPYPSADMLADYSSKGFPDLIEKVVCMIDQQIAHRQSLERMAAEDTERQQARAQWGAMVLGIAGTLGALVAGYWGVPSLVCVAVVVVAVGGPNAATIVGRLLDRVDGGRRG